MVLLKADIQSESHGLVPLASPFDKRVLRLRIQLPLGEHLTLMNLHAHNPAVDKKLFREELVDHELTRACLMAGDMHSLIDAQDANYNTVWLDNEKAAMRLE